MPAREGAGPEGAGVRDVDAVTPTADHAVVTASSASADTSLAAATVAAAKPAKSVSAPMPEVRAAYQIRPAPLPRGAADAGGRELEGPVGDAGVEVHAAVVVRGVDVVVHRGRPAGPCRAAGRRRPCRARP